MASSAGAALGAPTEYPGTIHRKAKGTLTLSDSDLTFRPESSTSKNGGSTDDTRKTAALTIPWSAVAKHQVSPATHPKHLLRVLLKTAECSGDDGGSKKKPPAKAFELSSRSELDRVRKDVTGRLQKSASGAAVSNDRTGKRKRTDDGNGDDIPASPVQFSSPSYTDLDPSTIAVARSSLLSSSPTLRSQHDHLVTQTQTLTEESFWSHHAQSVADEAARIHGRMSAGQSSTIKSNLDLGPRGRVRLGVEEMRQIFIMYPAVHAAYEEKVPLELSEEQFWRRYLESEFFHRDRGRIGAHIGKTVEGAALAGGGEEKKDDGDNKMDKKSAKEDEAARKARLGAAGANDLFSRVEAEQRQGTEMFMGGTKTKRPKVGGQFDLAATAASDRGDRVLNATDLFPQDAGAAGGSADGTTARVIDKYNRHSRLVVLHSDEPVATASKGVVDEDGGEESEPGTDAEMRRLVGFADATEDSADHVHGTVDGMYEELFLRNVGAYSGNMGNDADAAATGGSASSAEEVKKRVVLSKAVAATTREMATQLLQAGRGTNGSKGKSILEGGFPPAALGKELLSALTKRMAQNSSADTDATAITNQMPSEFRDKLNSYFRRSSELLRHFFGIRDSLDDNEGGVCSKADLQKLNKIVKGMEKVYREMEAMRKSLPQSKLGEAMRKMCVPIMDQLDLAFKLHRENASGRAGGGGGFVTVEEL